jgi:hypothetical protein
MLKEQELLYRNRIKWLMNNIITPKKKGHIKAALREIDTLQRRCSDIRFQIHILGWK